MDSFCIASTMSYICHGPSYFHELAKLIHYLKEKKIQRQKHMCDVAQVDDNSIYYENDYHHYQIHAFGS